jgi:hypothetical protein
VVLEWDPIELATAELRSLSLYRNGTKAGVIPRDKLSTKISGLGIDTEYMFHLVLRTSAGVYQSEKVVVRTHKMTDLTGITVAPGVMAPQLKESLLETINRIGAKVSETVRIDTTHFVCTEPSGQNWEKAVEMNLPVVVPDWVKGCEREGRIVGVRGYYLGEDPKSRQIGPSQQVQAAQRLSVVMQGQQGMQSSPRIEHTPPTPERPTQEPEERESGGQRPASQRLAEETVGSVVEEDGGREGSREESRDGEIQRVVTRETEVGESDDDDEEEEEEEESKQPGKQSGPEVSLPERPADKGRSASAEEDDEEDDETDDRGDGKFDEVAL